MNRYRFKATNMAGKTIKGVLYAKDENDLREIVRNLNYFLVSFSKIAESSQIFTFLETISTQEVCVFCRLLSIMLTSGMQLTDALEIIRVSTKNKKLQEILFYTHNNLLKGRSLTDCFAKYPKTFPAFFRSMVHIGEITGKLDAVLVSLADYYEREMITKRKIKGAMSYPIMIICIAIVAVLVVSFYIMPTFEDVFASFDAELPALTQGLISFSKWLKANFQYVIVVVILLYIGRSLAMRTKPYHRFHDRVMLLLPIIGPLQYKIVTYRFCLGMSTFLAAGMSIPDSLEIMTHMMNNAIIEDRLQVTVAEMKRGKTIAKAVSTSGIFPSMLLEMITVGENTGSLDDIFKKAAAYYEDEMNEGIKKATDKIGPVMLFVVGGMVLVVILSVFEPMMGLMDAIGNQA